MVENKNRILIVFVLLLLSVFLVQMKVYIEKTHGTLYERLEESAVQNMYEVALNIDNKLKDQTTHTLYDMFKRDTLARKEFEKDLNLFVTSKVQYIYLIYKDEKNRFRFLADGSTQDKARFNQKIDVSEKYLSIYQTKHGLSVSQSSLEKLSITYIYPILRDDQVEALLVFDFSSTLTSDLEKILEPIEALFMVIYIMIGLFIFIAVVQAFYYYQVRKKSFIDALTQTYNRQYLRYVWNKIDLNAYHILMVDFDHFKKINDNYGHAVGDNALYEGALVMKNGLRKKDKIFRYGGEEFLIMIKKESVAVTENIANRIRQSIENHMLFKDDIPINLSVSIGINVKPHESKNINEAIKIADMMLYRAKANGRNCIVSNHINEQVCIEDKYTIGETIDNVKAAIEDDRIRCYFHCIVDSDNKIYKYEALVRYVAEDGTLVYPNHFLADIMYTSVYVSLCKRIIDLCIDSVIKRSISVSINFSINDLLNEELMNYFISELEELGDSSSLISIEILEDEELLNINSLKSVIDRFKTYGVKFAIDDFGSGYANFNYLAELNIDYIKIDGSLIQNVLESQNTRHIIKSIIKLAQEMNMKTIAEFVSSKEIYEEMLVLGVDYMQGYYISRPKLLDEN